MTEYQTTMNQVIKTNICSKIQAKVQKFQQDKNWMGRLNILLTSKKKNMFRLGGGGGFKLARTKAKNR
jgi:hypothetical protein